MVRIRMAKLEVAIMFMGSKETTKQTQIKISITDIYISLKVVIFLDHSCTWILGTCRKLTYTDLFLQLY